MQLDISSEFPTQLLPIPTVVGFEHVLCLSFCPVLQVLVQVLQVDHEDQPPFTAIHTGYLKQARPKRRSRFKRASSMTGQNARNFITVENQKYTVGHAEPCACATCCCLETKSSVIFVRPCCAGDQQRAKSINVYSEHYKAVCINTYHSKPNKTKLAIEFTECLDKDNDLALAPYFRRTRASHDSQYTKQFAYSDTPYL